MNRSIAATSLVLGFATSLSSAAQIPSEILIAEGDLLPNVGAVLDIDQIVITDTGRWAAFVRIDPATDGVESAIVVDGAVLIDSRASLPGLTVPIPFENAVSMEIDTDGSLLWVPSESPASLGRRAIYRDLEPIAAQWELVEADGLPAEAAWISFGAIRPDGSGAVIAEATIDLPSPASLTSALVRLSPAGGGEYATEVLFEEGDTLPGTTAPIQGFSTINETLDVDAFGRPLWIAYLGGVGAGIVRDDELIAVEGGPSPIFLSNWSDLVRSAIALNARGDYAHGGTIDQPFLTQQVLVWNGAVVAQSGQALDAIAPYQISDLFFAGFGPQAPNPLRIGPEGALYWSAKWSNPDSSNDVGLFRDYDLIVEEGVTTVEGQRLVELVAPGNNSLLFDVSASGNRVALWAELEDGRAAIVTVPSEDGISSLPSCSIFDPRLSAFGIPAGGGDDSIGAQIGNLLVVQLEPGFEALSSEAVDFLVVSTGRLFGAGPCGLDLPGIGEVQVDFSAQKLVASFPGSGFLPPTGIASLSFVDLPNDQNLVGTSLYWQGFVIDPAAPSGNTVRPSNALEVIVNP